MIILGVDPGSVVCGYGVVLKNGSAITLVEYGVVEARKMHSDFYPRLKDIFDRIISVIDRTKPDSAAFETMFYHKNAQTLIKLAHARSAAILSALEKNLPVHEYGAKEVKKAVTGRGNADKAQVQFMVKNLLKIEETPEFYDATDALAIAICHAIRLSSPAAASKSWADFVKQNPDRIL